jgi:DNA repair exonuclease SbcCD ATPase subunit
MAQDSDKLGYKDFFDEALFTPVIENVNALIASLQGLKDTIKTGVVPALNELKTAISAFVTNQQAGAEEARKVAETMAKVNNVANAYAKINDELIRLIAKKIELESEAAKAAAVLRLEVKEAEKALKRYAQATTASTRAAQALEVAEKALKGQIDANVTSYYHLSDALNDLRERYKSLVLAGQENTEEAARLRDAIVQLDAKLKKVDEEVGQFQRNVGNYTKSFKDAMTEFLGASGEAGEAILALSFAAERARDAFKAAGGGVKGFFRAIVEGAKALRGVGIMLLLEGISKLLSAGKDIKEVENAERKLKLASEELRINNELAAIKLRLATLDTETIKGLTEKGRLLARQAEKEIELINLRRAYIREEIERTEKEIKEGIESPLTKLLQWLGKALSAIVRMLAYIPEGLAEVLKALRATDAANVLSDIADKAREAATNIEKAFTAFAMSDTMQAKMKLAELRKEFEELNNQEEEIKAELAKASKEIAEEQEKFIEAAVKALTVELESVGTARERLRQEYEKKFRELENAFNEHVKKLEGNVEAIEKIKNAYLTSVAGLRAEMARKDEEIVREAVKKIDEIRRQLLQSALDIKIAEINNKFDALAERLKEAYAELGEENQELFVQLEERRQQEIRRAILEAADNEIKLRQEIAVTMLELERSRFKSEEDFMRYKERKLAELQIEYAKKRLEALHDLFRETNDATIELEIARMEALIAQANAKLKEMLRKEREEIVREYVRAIQAITDALSNYISKIEERQLGSIEKQQAALRSRIAVFEGLAKQGALAADQSIAELEAREAELIRKQEELKKKAQRRELALAAIKTYVQLLDRNAPSPLAQTLRDITAITQFVSRLPTFFYGTEYVKDGVRIPNAVRDALIVRVHEGERIVPAHINRQLMGIKNEDLPKLIQTVGQTTRIEFDYDTLSNAIVTSITEGNKKKRIRRRL